MTPHKKTVLIVDDAPENIEVVASMLNSEYRVTAATSGESALHIIRKSPPDIVLLDIVMAPMDGYEVCAILKADAETRHIPVILVTSKDAVEDEVKGFKIGAVDYITKPVSAPVVQSRVATHLALSQHNKELERNVQLRTQQLRESRLKVIQRLSRAGDYKDDATGLHILRMSQYAKILGLAAGMREDEADMLLNAAPMHDIGKIGIPDYILQKKGRLTEEEFEKMKEHCRIGADIIGDDPSELMQMARAIALSHHEKWDGTGYPQQLKGEEIPRPARIVAIADIFDALTSKRPYKDAWSVKDAVNALESASGKFLDPQLVTAFISVLPQILEVKEQYSE